MRRPPDTLAYHLERLGHRLRDCHRRHGGPPRWIAVAKVALSAVDEATRAKVSSRGPSAVRTFVEALLRAHSWPAGAAATVVFRVELSPP